MGGYLSSYGAGTEKRENAMHATIKWSLIALAAVCITLFTIYFVFPNRSEQAVVRQFFQLLAARDYKAAYALWGCTDAQPCRNFDMTAFMGDWGPPALTVGDFDVLSGESCGSGVIVDVDAGKGLDKKLWVERKTHILGELPPNIADLGRCPRGNRIYDFVRDLKYRMHGRTYK
jgi:hypothetical protein